MGFLLRNMTPTASRGVQALLFGEIRYLVERAEFAEGHRRDDSGLPMVVWRQIGAAWVVREMATLHAREVAAKGGRVRVRPVVLRSEAAYE